MFGCLADRSRYGRCLHHWEGPFANSSHYLQVRWDFLGDPASEGWHPGEHCLPCPAYRDQSETTSQNNCSVGSLIDRLANKSKVTRQTEHPPHVSRARTLPPAPARLVPDRMPQLQESPVSCGFRSSSGHESNRRRRGRSLTAWIINCLASLI